MLRSGRKLIQAALILGLGSIGFSSRSEAAFFGQGIIVDSTNLMSTPDPMFEYDIHLSLTQLTQTTTGDFITFHNVSQVVSGQFNSIYANFQVIDTMTSPGFFDVTLSYTGALNLANFTTSNLPLGDLIVVTAYNYDPANIPPILLKPLTYNGQVHDLSVPPNAVPFGGTTTPVFVPEPASLALIALGLPSALLLARRSRRVAP